VRYLKQYIVALPHSLSVRSFITYVYYRIIRGPFEKFVDWRQCAAFMQREAVTLMPNFSGGGEVLVA
jgi:hypothetical protein